jgi:arylsulfatase B
MKVLYFIFLFGSVFVSVLGQSNHIKKRPNIILLLADDLGYGELGCQGNADIPTPHIDKLAGEGIRFTNAYVTCSYCSPSRAGLLTGRYPNRFGYETNMVGPQNEDPAQGLPPSEITLAEHLLEAGYISGIVGKWHLGGTAKYHPYRQGFDAFFGFMHEGHYYVPPPFDGVTTMLRRKVLPGGGAGRWLSEDRKTIYTTHMNHNEPDYDANNPILRGSQPVMESLYFTDAITREAIDFIDRNADRPFFLYLAYNAVHSPLQASSAYMDNFTHLSDVHRQIFAAMLANLDDSVGAIMRKLKDSGLEEETLVIFLSDNGGPTRELTSSNYPLRGGKGNYYEGGIRIPFIMRWKGVLPTNVIFNDPIISLDLYPTIAGLAGKPDISQYMDGVDIMPYLSGGHKNYPERTFFWSFKGKIALRNGDWKMVQNGPNAEMELFNLEEDVSESKNLAISHEQRLMDLQAIWQELNQELTGKKP